MSLLKAFVRTLLTAAFRTRVEGLAHVRDLEPRTLVVANHVSFLDGLFLAAYLPGRFTFAIHTRQAARWWLRPLFRFVRVFPMDPADPMAIKGLIRHVQAGNPAVIFPEGRISTTGALMKVYDGPGLIADRADAAVVAVHIDGLELSRWGRVANVSRRWFPRVRLRIQPAQRVSVPQTLRCAARRRHAGAGLARLLKDNACAAAGSERTLIEAVFDARRRFGGAHSIANDINYRALDYNALLTRSLVVAGEVRRCSAGGEPVGVLLPSAAGTAVVVLGISAAGRVPAMLNFTAGASGLVSACRTARIQTVFTSRRFIDKGGLDRELQAIAEVADVRFLEDTVAHLRLSDKLAAWLKVRSPLHRRARRSPDEAAVILFTSGSEGTPKGVVLSHRNLLGNCAQLSSVVDFNANDVVLNALPLFHSFGLTAGTLLPLVSGIKTFFYPSPLHYRAVSEIAYHENATILFGTNTFLAGYARKAHPYDFHTLRLVFAGAEKLHEDTRSAWMDRFGVRVLEGYGATETAPVLAVNTPLAARAGSVGRLLPGIAARLDAVPGIETGGRLQVRGPNVMRGYLLADRPGHLVPPADGWYDTGDIVHIDEDGYLFILGRAKRFAKLGGEMVSLAAIESWVSACWPDAEHAVAAVPDRRRGERLVLVTTRADAARAALSQYASAAGISELQVPREIRHVARLPLLGSGKPDYAALGEIAAGRVWQEVA